MRSHFEKYGNVLHIDGTYCTNDLKYALYFFSVKDAFGKFLIHKHFRQM